MTAIQHALFSLIYRLSMIPLLVPLEVGESASSVVHDLIRAHQEMVHALVDLDLLGVLVPVTLLPEAVALSDVLDEVRGVDRVDQLSGMP